MRDTRLQIRISYYHQICMKECDIHKTTFRAHEGHYICSDAFWNAHLYHLRTVFEILKSNCLWVNYNKKFCFGVIQLEYLRHIISSNGIKADPNKLQKKNFRWDKEAQKAFQEFKAAMEELATLARPNIDQPFEIETDASCLGFGVILMQQGSSWTFVGESFH
ncbi:hypothetical protein CR513_50587, partial [Mucuna pruriens]